MNAHKGKSKISMVSANKAKKLISSRMKFVLILLRLNQQEDKLVKVKASLEGCIEEKKDHLVELLHACREVL